MHYKPKLLQSLIMRRICFLLFLICCSFQGIDYRHIQTHDPWSIHVLEVNPKECEIFPVHANDQALGRETVKNLVIQHQAIAGINGGFFKGGDWDGLPAGILKINHEWVGFPTKPRGAIGWSEDALHVFVDQLLLSALLEVHGLTIPIDGLNRARGSSELILFSPALRNTFSPPGGLELVVWHNQIIAKREEGNTPIPAEGCVISIGPKANLPFWKSIPIGTPIQIKVAALPQSGYTASTDWLGLPYIVGGVPVLVRNGKPIQDFSSEQSRYLFLHFNHARTAVGILPNGNWLFVVIDANQISKGITIPELATLMHKLGCIEALNLDGGGSSTMVINRQVINDPTGDEDEDQGLKKVRKVGDAILIREKS